MSASSLSSWLVSQEACVKQGRARRFPTGFPAQYSVQIPSHFLSPSFSLCLSVCPYLPSSDGFLYPATSPTWLGSPTDHSSP